MKRHAIKWVGEHLRQFPAVLVNGARQIGKSTLAEQLVKEGLLRRYLTLDQANHYSLAMNDPDEFIGQWASEPIALDEIQRVPDLMRALKKTIDQHRKKGQFLLTGSANILSHPKVSESLAGRMSIVPMEGLSIGEINAQKNPSPFLDLVFSTKTPQQRLDAFREVVSERPILTKKNLGSAIFFGSYPELALTQEAAFNRNWFHAYLTAYIERDVYDLSRSIDRVSYGRLYELVGLNSGNLLNTRDLSISVGVDQRTVKRYLEILAITFQAHYLRPWFSNVKKRLIKTPKVYLNDSGCMCQLYGIDSPSDLEGHLKVGAIFETWVWGELRKLMVFDPTVKGFLYRTHLGKEVDFLLKKGQRYCGVEVKWASRVQKKDFSGLIDMQEAVRKESLGVVLYTGEEVLSFSDNLLALPISVLL